MYIPTSTLFTLILTIFALHAPIKAQTQDQTNRYLNITALTYTGNASILQCWSILPPFALPSDPLAATFSNLGPISGNATYIIQPAGSVGKYRNAPGAQYSILLTGLIHITLPFTNDPGEAWVTAGRNSIIYADDVYTTGHYTTFPGPDETVLLGIPVRDGPPEHRVVRERGGCEWRDLVG